MRRNVQFYSLSKFTAEKKMNADIFKSNGNRFCSPACLFFFVSIYTHVLLHLVLLHLTSTLALLRLPHRQRACARVFIVSAPDVRIETVCVCVRGAPMGRETGEMTTKSMTMLTTTVLLMEKGNALSLQSGCVFGVMDIFIGKLRIIFPVGENYTSTKRQTVGVCD